MDIKTTKEMITDLISICKDNSCNLKDLLTTINISKEDKKWVAVDSLIDYIKKSSFSRNDLIKSLSIKNNKKED